MKLVFFGTADFGVPSLEAIVTGDRHQIVAAVTGPDKPRGRGLDSTPTPIAAWCEKHAQFPVYKPGTLADPGFVAALRQIPADCFVVIAFRILPESVYAIPRFAFNLHASLLPAYRGAAPIQRAIMAGETQTGVTTFLLRQSVDTGAIIGQKTCPIPPSANAGEMFITLSQLGASLVLETLDGLESGHATLVGQDDSKATRAPKLTDADLALDFNRTAMVVRNHVRGLSPRPGATAIYRENPVKILALLARNNASLGGQPGEIVAMDKHDGPVVQTAEGQVTLELIQPAGKRPMTGAEFARGYRPEIGELFQRPRLKTT